MDRKEQGGLVRKARQDVKSLDVILRDMGNQ